MWQRACPNAMLLAGFGGVFEALPFDGTGFAEGFRRFDSGFSNFFVGDVFGEKQVGHFPAGCSTSFFDCQ